MSEKEKPEKMELPVVMSPICPACGSTKRLGATLLQQLKDEGALHKDSFPDVFAQQITLLDQSHPPAILSTTIIVKQVVVYWDVCECGTWLCTKFDCIDVPMRAQPQQQQPPPGRGFMPPLNGRMN